MGNIGDPIVSGSIPAVGTSGTTYASQLNLFLTEVKNRLESAIPKASLADGPLDMNGSEITNVSYLGLADAGATPTVPNNSFQTYNGEVYWVSATGVTQITDSGSINTANIGAITGDYGGLNPAQFRFVDADQEYYAYDDFNTGTWAYVWARAYDIAKNSTSTTRIRLSAPSSLASSFTLTLPDKPASVTELLTIDTSGNIITTTEAGYVKNIPAIAGEGSTYMNLAGTYGSYYVNTTGGINKYLILPITLDIGDTITAFAFDFGKSSDATQMVYMQLVKIATAGPGAETNSNFTNSTANAPGAITLTASGVNQVVTSGFQYVLQVGVQHGSAVTADAFYGGRVTYTHLLKAA